MTQQEIRERNTQIALMVGYVNTTPTDKDFNIFEYPTKIGVIPKMIETMSMQFHSDWNWLMEAVEFICSIGGSYSINNKSCAISVNEPYWFSKETVVKTNEPTIEAVFTTVSDFAKLYNEKKL